MNRTTLHRDVSPFRTGIRGPRSLAKVGLGLFLTACSPQSDSANESGAVDDGGWLTCEEREGRSCSCGDGFQSGELVCDGNETVCECDRCPEFEPEPKNYSSCGGDLWGTWRLVDVEPAQGQAATVFIDEEVRTCTVARSGLQVLEGRLFLVFEEGGGLRISAREDLRYSVSFPESCAFARCSEASVPHMTIFDRDSGSSSCRGECTCTCDVTFQGMSDDKLHRWEQLDQTVQLLYDDATSDSTATFHVCAENNQLELVGNGLVYRLERGEIQGVPEPCSSASGNICEDIPGCSLGVCVGENLDCGRASSSGECGTYPGCTWDFDGCQGDSPTECDVYSVELVPGCTFVPS